MNGVFNVEWPGHPFFFFLLHQPMRFAYQQVIGAGCSVLLLGYILSCKFLVSILAMNCKYNNQILLHNTKNLITKTISKQ